MTPILHACNEYRAAAAAIRQAWREDAWSSFYRDGLFMREDGSTYAAAVRMRRRAQV